MNSANRVNIMRSEERPSTKPTKKQDKEMLSDLKEASKEGGNSISLSP